MGPAECNQGRRARDRVHIATAKLQKPWLVLPRGHGAISTKPPTPLLHYSITPPLRSAGFEDEDDDEDENEALGEHR